MSDGKWLVASDEWLVASDEKGTHLAANNSPQGIHHFCPRPSPLTPHSAYTLIEVLVALTVLIIGFSALATMTNQARQSARAAEELSTAQLACQTRINELLSGIRTITPVFNEAVTGLDNWFLTVELFPATKPGVTAVRVQMSRNQPPGGTAARVAGADFFEITQWIGNTRIDPQLLRAMQQNPYSLTVGGMMSANTPAGMMRGPTSLVDASMANTIPGGMMQNSMMQTGMLPSFDAYGTMPDAPPPLSLGNDTDNPSSPFTTSEQRRAYRDSLRQNSRQTMAGQIAIDQNSMGQTVLPDINMPDAPPPLALPLEAPIASTIGATTTPATLSPPPPDDVPATSPTTNTGSPGDVPSTDDTPSPDDTPSTGRNRPQGGNASPGTSGGRGGNPSNRRGGGP